jgi:ABC-type oligopeptide transport system substrate-binding subunit
LEANPNYWRSDFPKSDGLIFSFGVSPQEILQGFRTGRFSIAQDLLPSDVEALRHEPQFASRYGEVPTLSTYYVVFNIHRGPLSDEKTRRNLVKLVDVESLVRRSLGRIAIPANGLIPPGLPGYEPAAQRNKTSLGDRPPEQMELSVMLNSVYEGPYAALVKELFRTLQEKGIRIRIEGTSFEQYDKTAAAGSIDFALSRWLCDFPDSDSFIHGLLHTEAGILGKFCGTPEMNQLIERGRTETRPELRHEIYREAEELIARHALLLPLFHEQTYRFARPELEGFKVTLALQSIAYEKLWQRR